jgi:putative transcriptional regulator
MLAQFKTQLAYPIHDPLRLRPRQASLLPTVFPSSVRAELVEGQHQSQTRFKYYGPRDRSIKTHLRLRLPVLVHALMIVAVACARIDITAAADQDRFITGQLLVATPETKDPRFAEAVIFMVKHDADGAFGLVINRPLAKSPFEDLLKGFGTELKGAKAEVVIHYGGPVGARQGFVLHSDDVVFESSMKLTNGMAMTADVKMIEAMARGKGPKQSILMLGYAGWAPGQLEAELRAHSWFVIAGDKSLIFGKDAAKKWQQAMDKRQIPL